MIDTPRTDDAQYGTGRVTLDFARQLERELNEAIKRIHILEDAGDILAEHHLLLVKTREEAKAHVAEWIKAMEAKS